VSQAEYERLQQQVRRLEKKNRELSLQLESFHEWNADAATPEQHLPMSLIYSLVAALDSRDPYTAGHSSRVALYSLWIAGKLGLDEEENRHFYQATLMHDIGKIGVPDRILLKSTSLSEQEFQIMISHTTKGANILSRMGTSERAKSAVQIARHHHEKMDGSGYPDGLIGEQIPYLARIVAVADAFDAMTTDRPYSEGRSYQDGVKEIVRCKGTHFDPLIVEAFSEVMRDRDYLRHFDRQQISDEFQKV
jgi:putative nucleotidyltransferase with HDIG domain